MTTASNAGSFPGRLTAWWRRDKEGGGGESGIAGPSGVQVGIDELIQLRLRARGFNLDSRRRVASASAGLHASRFRGRGIDFQETRGYQPGDDIRHMDWRVTARSGRPHTKLYREERERPVIVMVDLNASMFFGTRQVFKSVLAVQAAALIGWAAIHNGDRIGVFVFGGGRHHEIPPAGGRRGALGLIRELVSWTEPRSQPVSPVQGGLGEALRRLRRVARPGSLVFIFSDFYALDQDTERHLMRLRQHNDVVACLIADVLELAPPPPGRYGISDGSHSGVLDTAATRTRRAYEAYCARRHAHIEAMLRKHAVPMLRLVTGQDVADGLRRGLADPVLARASARRVTG